MTDELETWRDLEGLAARIYSELEPGCKVNHDARLYGTLSGGHRQIDVLIESPSLGTRVVVDCKDWTRRADVNDVGQFAMLVEDVGATAGVMICNRGFSKQGRTLARNKGLMLCGLHDAQSRKWQLDVLMPVVWRRLSPTGERVSVSFKGRLEKGDQLSRESPLRFRVAGRVVDPLGLFAQGWNAGAFPLARAGLWSVTTEVEMITLAGAFRPGTLRVEFRVTISAKLGYVTPQESRGILHAESGAYQTVVLNVGETLNHEPEGGWKDVGHGSDLVIAPHATVLQVVDVEGLGARIESGLLEIRFLGEQPGEGDPERPGG